MAESDWEVVPESDDSDWEVVDEHPAVHPAATYFSSFSPKGLTANIYGAKEALKGNSFSGSRAQAYKELEESEHENPRAAMLGKMTPALIGGIRGYLPATIPAAATYGGTNAALESNVDPTQLDKPEQYQRLAKDVGIGTAAGAVGGSLGTYAPKTAGAVALGALGGELVSPGKGAVPGALVGLAARGASGPLLSSYLASRAASIPEDISGLGFGDALKSKAANLAETATGATRTQAEKFAPGSGRQLLDKRIVRFGDSPMQISQRAADMMERSGADIGTVLKTLDEQGVTVSKQDIVNGLQAKISVLSKDESQAGVVSKLQGILEDIANTPDSRPVSEVEAVKRGFQKQSNYMKPNTTSANKATANVYREQVENAATKANPELAEKFQKDKELYGLLAPIQEASEKRALQLQQHPIGGLNDMAAAGVGAMAGGPPGAVATPIARRIIAPRTASSLAVILDKTGNGINTVMQKLQSSPNGQKLAPMFQSAMQRGHSNFAATYFLMNQTNDEFRQLMNEGNE